MIDLRLNSILIVLLSIFVNINSQKVHIKSKNPAHLTRYSDKQYIVNLKDLNSEELQLSCVCTASVCSNFNFTFDGRERVVDDKVSFNIRIY